MTTATLTAPATPSPAPTLPNPAITRNLVLGEVTVDLPLLHAGAVCWLRCAWVKGDPPDAAEVTLDGRPLWACDLGVVLDLLGEGRQACRQRTSACWRRGDRLAARTWRMAAACLGAAAQEQERGHLAGLRDELGLEPGRAVAAR